MRRKRERRGDSGYMLLVLMIAVAVLTITMLQVAQNYRRSILRDREVEMIHRGEQYARAVKRYYKKTGNYPISIAQLENSNNIRFLRKKYKDPMSPDGEWKLVHQTDVKLNAGGGLTAAGGAGSNQLGSSAGGLSSTTTTTAAASQSSAFGSPAATPTSTGDQTAQGTTAANTTADTAGGTGTTGAAGNSGNVTGSTGPASSGQVLGGGPILGVVSKSKAEGIHSFGKKTKYNEWFFIYDPSQDRGQQLVGPYNPAMNLGASAATPAANGTTGTQGTQNTTTPSAATPGAFAPSTPAPTTPTTTTP
jgi:type II secretory pathway pseudopilin PulG